jgi:hypothetical protein
MTIREMLSRDFGIEVRISGGEGKRDDPYVIEACDAEEAALTQWNFLRGLGYGRGTLWRIVEWTSCDVGSATEVVRIEQIHFGESVINTDLIAFYFDTRAVSGLPHSKQPLTAWRGPIGTPMLPRDLGWLHFDQIEENTGSPNAFDQTIQYNGQGAKAGVSIYSSPRTEAADARIEELKLAVQIMHQALPNLQAPWPPFEAGPFVMAALLTGDDLTMVCIAVSGQFFIKVRLTFFDDLKMRELMNASLHALAACTQQTSSVSH